MLKCCFCSTMKRMMNLSVSRVRGGVLLLASALAALWLSGCSPSGAVLSGGSPYAPADASVYREAKPEAGRAVGEKPRQKAAEERPGLATGFGESTRSEWNRQSFVRATPSRPAGTGVIFYNDKEGIEAMTGYRRKVDPIRKAAGEVLEWGIKGSFGYLPTYVESGVYGGTPRTFVVGSRDSNYTIVLKNRCKSRLEVVLSVDGLDVIDGKSASFSKRGYVIAPEETF